MNNNEFFDKYKLVYRKLVSIFSLIYDEFNTKDGVNPIEHIKYRIKKLNSIEHKLISRGLAVNEDNINKLYDIVGVRVVCSFLSDLEIIKNLVKDLEKNGILEIVLEKDYVTKPKENSGYSSYHILIRVPINYNNKIEYVNAEIQIRTIAMDMSASLEHKSCYKKDKTNDSLKLKLKEATSFCRKIDEELDNIVKSTKGGMNKNSSVLYPFFKEDDYSLFKLKYENALLNVKDKFLVLAEEYDKNGQINPMEHIKSRIKNKDEIIRKLISKKKVVSINNIEKYVNDFAGFKIVCSFISDLETLKEYIRNDLDFKIIEEKDYITKPKESGYRGYHFLVGVPVYTLSGVEYVKVEIQLRTIAMEMWASLEEKIGYHKNPSKDIVGELQRISSVISVLDNQLDLVYNESKKDSSIKKLVKN